MSCVIDSPSRLHLGIINPFGAVRGRLYGCVGIAITYPRTKLVVERRSDDRIVVEGPFEREISEYAEKVVRAYGLGGVSVKVINVVKRNVGLGSTTQLALSVAYGVLRVYGVDANVVEVSRLLGRGKVSGVGTYVFKHGGLVIDSGKRCEDDFPGILMRLEVPDGWHFVVVIPEGRGPSEDEEEALFRSGRHDPVLTYEASYILFHELVPAVIERDAEGFGSALTRLQRVVGMMFSGVQGGVYNQSSQKVVSLLERLDSVLGYGQSSWGPTVYAFTDSISSAKEIAERVRGELNVECFVTRADNRGALISCGSEDKPL